MVAGGTGLAPLRALLIEMSKRADSPPTHIFYGMRYPGELYDLSVLRRIASTNPWLQVTAVSEEEQDPWWITAVAAPAELGIDHRIGTLADVVVDAGNWENHQVLIAGVVADDRGDPAQADHRRGPGEPYPARSGLVGPVPPRLTSSGRRLSRFSRSGHLDGGGLRLGHREGGRVSLRSPWSSG